MSDSRQFDYPTPVEPHLNSTVCAVCQQPLNRWEESGAEPEWRHTRQRDHAPVPTPAQPDGSNVKGLCDVCSAPDPQWIIPVRVDAVFDLVTPGGASIQSRDVAPIWIVCDDCQPLADIKDANALARRSITAHSRLLGEIPPEGEAVLHSFQVHFVESIIGPAERITT